MRGLRAVLLAVAFTGVAVAGDCQSLTVLDVPFIAQSELLCGGAAASMVMRYWGARGIDAESFSPLLEKSAGGIRTATLAADLRERQWNAIEVAGTGDELSHQIQQRRPVIVLLEDRPRTFHYVVVVARSADGVVFHDPARTPFRVLGSEEFDRRWSAAHRWMLVVTPGALAPVPAPSVTGTAVVASPHGEGDGEAEALTSCDRLVGDAVRDAQRGDLTGAERSLVSAMSCPGAAPLRELAGLRVLQRRWPEVIDLADAAIARDPSDAYSWKLLATARFVENDRGAALDAWNRAGEPRIDLIRLDGLTRTRHAVVQQQIGLTSDSVLTSRAMLRARRRLGELPSGPGTLDFQPVPSGLVEVRGVVPEQPMLPHGAFDLAALFLGAAIRREVIAPLSSPTGGGERLTLDWRFWAHRPLYKFSFAAPAPWRGVLSLSASRETQPYSALVARTIHDSVSLDVADWATPVARWQLGAGVDRWDGSGSHAMAAAGVRFARADDRLDSTAQVHAWFGGNSFQSGELVLTARTSPRPVGTVVVATGGVQAVSASAPADLWIAGDTGRARPLALRAHPILTEGERFRVDRLGRLVGSGSLEIQRWWVAGLSHVGAAAFVDTARTAKRLTGPAMTDIDVGIGFRAAAPGKSGSLAVNLAKGLRDGEMALSVVYTP